MSRFGLNCALCSQLVESLHKSARLIVAHVHHTGASSVNVSNPGANNIVAADTFLPSLVHYSKPVKCLHHDGHKTFDFL
jgi:hypothetical protein